MKHKRVWTEEQKAAAAERMKHARAVRMSKISAKKDSVSSNDHAVAVEEKPVIREVSPEVQAVIDTMTPERKAKLQAIQARQWQRDASEDKATREALERHEAGKNATITLPEPETRNLLDAAGVGGAELMPEGIKVEWKKLPETVLEVPFKTPFRLTGSQSGLMISELSPCVCGETRLKWHPVCLKVKVNG